VFENTAVEQLNGEKFIEQTWTRDKKGIWMAGENSNDTVYIDRALHNGNVFEKWESTTLLKVNCLPE